jgi:cytochrome b561
MEKYVLSMRVMHWLMAVLIITLLSVGLWMSGLPNDYPGKFDSIYPMHKSFGILALILICIRLVERFRNFNLIPSLPDKIKKFDQKLSKAIHHSLYACMLLMPLSGYTMSVLGGHQVVFFGLELPSIFGESKDLSKVAWQIHGITGFTLIALIALHLAGNVKHFVLDKVNLISRMW